MIIKIKNSLTCLLSGVRKAPFVHVSDAEVSAGKFVPLNIKNLLQIHKRKRFQAFTFI